MPDSTITIVGNIVDADGPELRFTNSGQAVANFTVAVNRRWMNRTTNEWEEETSYIDVTAWGQLGENVSESCPKGARVVVTGRINQQTWENKEGEKRSKLEVVADEVGPSLRFATAEIVKNERRD